MRDRNESSRVERLEYLRLSGVPKRSDVFFSRGAAPSRTLAIAKPSKRLARVAYWAGYLTSGARRHADLPAAISDLLNSLDLKADEGTLVLRRARDERIVMSFGTSGRVQVVVKADRRSPSPLNNEAMMLQRLEACLPAFAPKLLKIHTHSNYTVLHQAAASAVRRGPHRLEEIVDICLSMARADVTHGDLAEWNLLRTPTRTVVCDWESGLPWCVPVYDLAHYVVQSGSLLHRWSARSAVALICSPRSPGARYASGIGISSLEARNALARYLQESLTQLDKAAPGFQYRRRMLDNV